MGWTRTLSLWTESDVLPTSLWSCRGSFFEGVVYPLIFLVQLEPLHSLQSMEQYNAFFLQLHFKGLVSKKCKSRCRWNIHNNTCTVKQFARNQPPVPVFGLHFGVWKPLLNMQIHSQCVILCGRWCCRKAIWMYVWWAGNVFLLKALISQCIQTVSFEDAPAKTKNIALSPDWRSFSLRGSPRNLRQCPSARHSWSTVNSRTTWFLSTPKMSRLYFAKN